MPAVLLGRLTTCVLAAAIGIVPLAPPEHVHESHDADHHAIVHRHTEGHLLGHADHEDADHKGPRRIDEGPRHIGEGPRRIDEAPRRIDDDDDDAPELILSTAFTLPSAPAAIAAPVLETPVVIEPPAIEPLHRAADYVELLIHGPPRAPASLRAPPATHLL